MTAYTKPIARKTGLLILACAVGTAARCCVATTYIYREDGDRIMRAREDGTQNEEVLDTGAQSIWGLHYEPQGRRLYWGGRSPNLLRSCSPNGSDVRDLLTLDIYGAYDVAVDGGRRLIFWTELSNGRLRRADLGGSNVMSLAVDLPHPLHLALDTASGHVYWTDNQDGRIRRAAYDGADLQVILQAATPTGIEIDVQGRKLYWADAGQSTIQHANLDGSNVKLLVSSFGSLRSVALDLSAGKLYWVNDGNNTINRVNLDGSSPEVVVSGYESEFVAIVRGSWGEGAVLLLR